MAAWTVVLIVVAVVLVIAAVVAAVIMRQRRQQVLDRFGPEYDRTVERYGDDRKAAEADLLERSRRHDQLDLRPLSAETRANYRSQWQEIQSRFVDQPEVAVTEADALLNEVMRARGYPVDDFEEKADLVSVDHPQVVDDYRKALAIRQRNASRLASTEELREAVLRYRSLFSELLESDSGEVRGTAETSGFYTAEEERR